MVGPISKICKFGSTAMSERLAGSDQRIRNSKLHSSEQIKTHTHTHTHTHISFIDFQ